MKPHEVQYPTHDLELGAGVFAFKIWRHYLYGVKFTIYTDHRILMYFMDHSNLNKRQLRWLNVVKDYECEIFYHTRKVNLVADALSRKAASALVQGIYLRMIIDSQLLNLIKEAQDEGDRRENWKI